MRIQIKYQVVERVGVVVTHCPVNSAVPFEPGVNALKDLDLPHLLAKYKHSGRQHVTMACEWCD